jgi:hypothetical protein
MFLKIKPSEIKLLLGCFIKNLQVKLFELNLHII